jgi:hypothetical protein
MRNSPPETPPIQSNEKYSSMTKELESMCKIDQDMRENFERDPENFPWDSNVDYKNTQRMKEIIAEIWWPTISKVGREGASYTWLLVQHADHDTEFQKKCLTLMRATWNQEVTKRDIAYLDDRIATSEGREQMYGTQFTRKSPTGRLQPFPIFDRENLNKRRQEVGLDTFEESEKRMYGEE